MPHDGGQRPSVRAGQISLHRISGDFDPLTNSVTMVTATDTFVIDLAAAGRSADAEGDGAASDAEVVDAEPVEDEPLDAASLKTNRMVRRAS